jgi:ATP-dependent Clp protease ATP-binding subunit ClpA
MYERFTDRSRRVMQLANEAAQRFRHENIGTEHILLGLVMEGSGVAANVLKNLDIDLRKVRLEVEKIMPPGQDGDGLVWSEGVVMGRLPHTARAKKVIDYSVEEARRLHHNYVGTEHLLLGLLRDKGGVATQILTNLGLVLLEVRAEVLNLLGYNIPDINPAEEVAQIAKQLRVTDPSGCGLPPLTEEQLRTIRARIERINEMKQQFVFEQDFGSAAMCRDEAATLKLLLDWYAHLRGG